MTVDDYEESPWMEQLMQRSQPGAPKRKRIMEISDDLKALLSAYHWPGNVRELENLVERAIILADGETLAAHDFSDLSAGDPARPAHSAVAEAALATQLSIEEYIAEFVKRYQNRYSEQELAALLGIGRKALWVRRNRWCMFRSGASAQKARA